MSGGEAPETCASAGQIAVEHGLELANVGRSDAFAPRRDTPGAFTFASTLRNTRTLAGGAQGAARARTNGHGFLGGLAPTSIEHHRKRAARLGGRTEQCV